VVDEVEVVVVNQFAVAVQKLVEELVLQKSIYLSTF
jgi:hypothetical protein